MASTSIENITFKGGGGTLLPAFCVSCGPTTISLPFVGMEKLSLKNTIHDCNKCGKQIHVRSGHYEFRKQVVQILADAKITKKQARRFSQKVKTANDLNSLPVAAETINKKLEAATKLALKQPNPKSALTTTAEIAVFLAAMAGGLLASDDIYDRYMLGEFFENHKLKDSYDVEEKAGDETSEKPNTTNEQQPTEGWKPIDV